MLFVLLKPRSANLAWRPAVSQHSRRCVGSWGLPALPACIARQGRHTTKNTHMHVRTKLVPARNRACLVLAYGVMLQVGLLKVEC